MSGYPYRRGLGLDYGGGSFGSFGDGSEFQERPDSLPYVESPFGSPQQNVNNPPYISPFGPPQQDAPAGGAVHVVQRGETLGGIAARYGTTAAALARANNIANVNLIFVGQRLAIPGASAAAVAPVTTGGQTQNTTQATGADAAARAAAEAEEKKKAAAQTQQLLLLGGAGLLVFFLLTR